MLGRRGYQTIPATLKTFLRAGSRHKKGGSEVGRRNWKKHFIAKGMSRAQRMRKCSREKVLQKDRIKFYYTLKKSKLYPCRTEYFHILKSTVLEISGLGKYSNT